MRNIPEIAAKSAYEISTIPSIPSISLDTSRHPRLVVSVPITSTPQVKVSSISNRAYQVQQIMEPST
jgi:hypothetical protein